jgi:predicted ATPase
MDERSEWARHGPLAGRGAELDDLDAVLSDVADGVGATVVIEGEAGVGKSALVGSLREGAALLGVDLRVARARHADCRPFGLLVDALVAPDEARGPVESELCALVDQLVEDPSRPRERAVELATAVIRRYGGARPWVLVLEDVQEADAGSLEALECVAREGVMPGGMLVMTMRPVPHRPELAATIAAWTRAGARYVELRPLSPEATAEVAERLVGGPVGPLLRGTLATTGGNPRLVADVVRTARVHGGLERRDGVADVSGSAWLEPLDEVVRGRLEYLGPDVLRLLEQASVLGSSFVVADLAALTEEPVEQCWRTLRHGLAAGVVRARGDRLVFGHDLCRAALYHGLDEGERRALHARAAWALDRAGAPSQIVDDHLARAR